MMLAAVRQGGVLPEFVSEALQADREVVLTAVQQSGHDRFRVLAPPHADRAVVLVAVGQSGSMFYHLPVLCDDRR